MLDDIQVDVEKLVAPVVEQAGLDLVEVIVLQKQGTYQIEV
jgi:ribosome maturation factor RimP